MISTDFNVSKSASRAESLSTEYQVRMSVDERKNVFHMWRLFVEIRSSNSVSPPRGRARFFHTATGHFAGPTSRN